MNSINSVKRCERFELRSHFKSRLSLIVRVNYFKRLLSINAPLEPLKYKTHLRHLLGHLQYAIVIMQK